VTEEEWDALPVESIPIEDVVFMLDNINVAHIWPDPHEATGIAEGPIRLALLSNGTYLVRDGRHRVIRRLLASSESYVRARVVRHG
jgi:hypothetical protein